MADDTIETFVSVAHAMSVKGHPRLDPAYARAPQPRLRKQFGSGMKGRDLEQIVHARQRFFAYQRRKRAVNQYDCNPLRQMAVALLEGLPHGQFHPNLQTFQRSF
ncbi:MULTISPECIES: hypothetical protein [unclassified Bradyrhizobium]|uniref:hypothetical protein n=1 Tax=unclassified Bradyrhizobium TaxID=2631580 RepID=UPI000745EC0E|nr:MULTISPECIES: hypothetical protein [unclassified Bradyrhizobium]AMA57443.1 hypothetical protein BCCGELA001_15015 [Bradyrhizobium sp. CCGE-LA001]KYH00353.1 hypothetical protein SE91_19195 [Bradyrhizobium sp. DOA1]